MAFSPKESIQADLLCSHLASAIKSFSDLSTMMIGEGVSRRVALLAASRLAAITLQASRTPTIEADGSRMASRLVAQQVDIYLEPETAGIEEEEDSDTTSVLLLDDCGFTSTALGESETVCEECGEYHAANSEDHENREQPS